MTSNFILMQKLLASADRSERLFLLCNIQSSIQPFEEIIESLEIFGKLSSFLEAVEEELELYSEQ